MKGIELTLFVAMVGMTLATVGGKEATGNVPAKRRVLMGVMGDSISVAAMADTAAPTPSRTPPTLFPGPQPRVEEVDPWFVWDNRQTLSWASGTEVDSHFRRLARYYLDRDEPVELEVLNVAANGARSLDLPKQADELAAAMAGGRRSSLAYVTVFIGSNDACSDATPVGTPDDKMRAGILAALEKLAAIRQEERIKVLVPMLPRIAELGQATIRNARTLLGMRCEDLRNGIFKFCNPLSTWRAEEERLVKTAVVDAKNALLKSVAEEARELFPSLDIATSNALMDFPIRTEALSADCFHPNQAAQGLISDLLWRGQPWFR